MADFARHNVGGIAGNTVNQHQITGIVAVHSPKGIAVETANIALHIVKTVGDVVLFQQLGHVNNGHTTKNIPLVYLAIGHLHHFLIGIGRVVHRRCGCLGVDADRNQRNKTCQQELRFT